MAQMIPPVVSSSSPRSERDLFLQIKNDPEARDWVVFHSFDIRRHIARSEGEADLIIVVPNEGILCIEVKGCDVSRTSGLWTYGYEPPKTSSVGPFRQASDAAHSIRRFLGDRDPTLKGLLFYSAVAFTEIAFDERSLEWEPWQIITKSDFKRVSISSLFLAVLKKAHERSRPSGQKSNWYQEGRSRPGKSQIASIVRLLRKDFEYAGSGRNRVENAELAIRRFTDEQLECLDHIAEAHRVIFQGPAGTGKTFVAIESARRAIESGRSVCVLCFNSLLGSWLRAEVEPIAEIARSKGLKFYSGTYSSALLAIVKCPIPAGSASAFWNEWLPDAAVGVLAGAATSEWVFDELIVDEAQDLLSESALDFFDLLLQDGLSKGRWAMLGDFERQAIYGAARAQLGLESLKRRCQRMAVSFMLRTNCRNSAQISDAVTLVSGLSPGYKRVLKEGDFLDVEPIFYRSSDEQLALLSDRLTSLLRRFDPSSIVVLSAKSDSSSTASRLSAPNVRVQPFRDHPIGSCGSIRYTSIQAFKGLEASAIVVTDIEALSDDQAKALLYVAMSRARVELVMLIASGLRVAYSEVLNSGLQIALRSK